LHIFGYFQTIFVKFLQFWPENILKGVWKFNKSETYSGFFPDLEAGKIRIRIADRRKNPYWGQSRFFLPSEPEPRSRSRKNWPAPQHC